MDHACVLDIEAEQNHQQNIPKKIIRYFQFIYKIFQE